MSNDEQGTNQTVSPVEEQPGKDSFAIVGVGASAGGLEAFTQLLAGLPNNTGMAFVLVQHLDPTHESNLRDILSRATRIPVTDASQDLAVQPDHIYVIRPNTSLTISRGVLQVAARDQGRGLHLPFDHFLRSLAADRRTGAIGVILSGTGSDGTLGMEEIKAAGGITFGRESTPRTSRRRCRRSVSGASSQRKVPSTASIRRCVTRAFLPSKTWQRIHPFLGWI